MERDYEEVGQHVIFVDSHGQPRQALVQLWFHGFANVHGTSPGCNLVVVSKDAHKSDQYGRQTEHYTSVVHKSAQPAFGMYWCWPDEL